MTEFRYKLQPYTGRSSRFTCPKCGKAHEFSRYIDMETGEILADSVGRCNKIDRCGYHYTPKQYFMDNGIKPKGEYIPKPTSKPLPVSFIDEEVLDKTLAGYQNNDFIQYLENLLGSDITEILIDLYYIGTSNRYGGATVFWQVDINKKIRAGKIIKYDKTGHRVKKHNNWVHSVLELQNFNLKQCFFGEHILKEAPDCKVAIVESEKTAIVASAIYPNFTWIASGGAEGINDEKVKVLTGRDVTLFPDSSKDGQIYQKWKEKAKRYDFNISDFLEITLTKEQKKEGFDIADMFNYLKTTTKIQQSEEIPEPILPTVKSIPPKNVPKAHVSDKIPYNTPSPVALIDSKIENPPIFEGKELLVKNRCFTSIHGDNIELVGIKSYGFCGNWEKHKQANGYCRACLLNNLHTIKINGKLQSREYTQLEILVIQGGKPETL